FFLSSGSRPRAGPREWPSVVGNFALENRQMAVSLTVPSGARADRFLRFGPFELDRERKELFRSGSRVKLQNKVLEALLVLLEVPGDIVTREELRNRLWPGDAPLNYDANVNNTVNKLRVTLGDSPDQPRFIETIPRKGYSFMAPVALAAASA